MLLPPISTLFPYTTLFRSVIVGEAASPHHAWVVGALESVVHGIHAWLGLNVWRFPQFAEAMEILRSESTRLNSSHRCISYAVFCLKKKKKKRKANNTYRTR